jgi:hypothetical protein
MCGRRTGFTGNLAHSCHHCGKPVCYRCLIKVRDGALSYNKDYFCSSDCLRKYLIKKLISFKLRIKLKLKLREFKWSDSADDFITSFESTFLRKGYPPRILEIIDPIIEEYKNEVFLEMAQHYESTEQYYAAYQVYYEIGMIDDARRCYKIGRWSC